MTVQRRDGVGGIQEESADGALHLRQGVAKLDRIPPEAREIQSVRKELTRPREHDRQRPGGGL